MESELIRAALQGDEGAWAELKDSVAGLIQWRVSASVANGMDQDDANGEAAILFVEAVQDFDPERGCKFSTYLAHKLKALISADAGGPIANDGNRAKSHMPDGDEWAGASSELPVQQAKLLNTVEEKIDKLPPRLKEVVRLRLRGIGNGQVAILLGLEKSVVEVRYSRAVGKLRQMLL